MANHLCVEELTTEESRMYRSLARQFTEGLIFPVRQQIDDDKDHDKIVDPMKSHRLSLWSMLVQCWRKWLGGTAE